MKIARCRSASPDGQLWTLTFLSAQVGKKMGLKIESTKSDAGDRTYRIRIQPEDEEAVRKTVKDINEKIIEFKTQFAGKDMQDYIAMVLIWLATEQPATALSTRNPSGGRGGNTERRVRRTGPAGGG